LSQWYSFSFPAPSPTLALSLVIWGRKICGTVSELRDGVEHKFSDLPRDEARLVLGSYFLRFWSARRYRVEEDCSRFYSIHWPSSIHVRPRRTCVCCCCRAGLLGQEWLTRAASKPNSTALGFSCLKSCAATELGTPGASLTGLRATPGWEMYSPPKKLATRIAIWEAVSRAWSAPSHASWSRKKASRWDSGLS
jgi:hypothetical protein